MNPNEMHDLMTRLLEKSRRKEVNWRPGTSYDPQCFKVSLRKSMIEIRFLAPAADPDEVRISFADSEGQVVKSFSVSEGDDDWGLAIDLYQEARTVALGLSGVIEEIQHAIMSEGPIG